jgi:hypothetical protein
VRGDDFYAEITFARVYRVDLVSGGNATNAEVTFYTANYCRESSDCHSRVISLSTAATAGAREARPDRSTDVAVGLA